MATYPLDVIRTQFAAQGLPRVGRGCLGVLVMGMAWQGHCSPGGWEGGKPAS